MNTLCNEKLSFTCPGCNAGFSLENEFFNRKCQCEQCGNKFIVNKSLLSSPLNKKKRPKTFQSFKANSQQSVASVGKKKQIKSSYKLLPIFIISVLVISAVTFYLFKKKPVDVNNSNSNSNQLQFKATDKNTLANVVSEKHSAPLSLISLNKTKGASDGSLKSIVLSELPDPKIKVDNLAVPKTGTRPVGWANPGNLGMLGVVAQRSLKDRQYKVLVIETGSPSEGKLVPGDLIIGINGEKFKPENYKGLDKSAEVYSSYMEPNRAMGRALDKAVTEQGGVIFLTVKRNEKTGCVKIQLPWKSGFSKNYPWDCEKSRQLTEEIANKYIESKQIIQKEIYVTVWYGLFLLNLDPVKYRSEIDEIAKLVAMKVATSYAGDYSRGIFEKQSTWYTALYSQFLSEYAILTNQISKLKTELQTLANQLLDERMVGNLWGHNKSHNYGRLTGGFMGASSQAALALLCLKQAGANINEDILHKTMESIKASIRKESGQVSYGSSSDVNSQFDWNKINESNTQLGAESLMRQGAVILSMYLSGDIEAAKAAGIFGERMFFSHATHGIAPDWGIHDAARAYARLNPAACRKLLDIYRYRLNLNLRWDGGIELAPYRNRKDEEYSAKTFKAGMYIPAILGLMLTLPNKKIYLMGAGSSDQSAGSSKNTSASISAREVTLFQNKIYFCGSTLDQDWGLFEYDSTSGSRKLIQGGFKVAPHKLHVWNNSLIISSASPASLHIFDGQTVKEILKTRSFRNAPSNFTPFKNKLYFIVPPTKNDRKYGGDLYVTDGTKSGTQAVIEKAGLIPGGSTSWQTSEAHAQSIEVLNDKLIYVSCVLDDKFKPVHSKTSLYAFNGSGKPVKLMTGKIQVSTLDMNSKICGSYTGIKLSDKLFYKVDKGLWQTDGTTKGTLDCNLNVHEPNNFSIFKNKLVFSGYLKKGNKKSNNKGLSEALFLFDGQKTDKVFDNIINIRKIISTSQYLFFEAYTDKYGYELWKSNGTLKGTAILSDIFPGKYGSYPNQIHKFKDKILFTASGMKGRKLWQTDGLKLQSIDKNFSSLFQYIHLFDSENGLLVYNETGAENQIIKVLKN